MQYILGFAGSYLGQITSRKQVGTQDRQHPNRDMGKNLKSQNNHK